MRACLLKNTKSGEKWELGADTGLIGRVMEAGRYIPDLTYEVALTGEEMREFLSEFPRAKSIPFDRDAEYVLTAWDW